MKIGVDIDGVLNNIGDFMRLHATKFDYEKYNGTGIKNPHGYMIEDIFGWTFEQDREFWNEYFIPLIESEPAREKASEVLYKLKEEGNEIHLITSRYVEELPKHATKTLEQYIIDWLKENNIPYDTLNISIKNKAEFCKENNIDIMIDDYEGNVLSVSKYIPVLCFFDPYNAHLKGENIIHVYSWYDIYVKIKQILQKNT